MAEAIAPRSQPAARSTSTAPVLELVRASPCAPARTRGNLAEIAAKAASRAPGVASIAETVRDDGALHGVDAVFSPDGQRQDLRVSVRAYLGDFLELGWAVRDAIRRAAAAHGLEHQIGLIDVEVVGLVLPIEQLPDV